MRTQKLAKGVMHSGWLKDETKSEITTVLNNES
jgi:hypothetical protein